MKSNLQALCIIIVFCAAIIAFSYALSFIPFG